MAPKRRYIPRSSNIAKKRSKKRSRDTQGCFRKNEAENDKYNNRDLENDHPLSINYETLHAEMNSLSQAISQQEGTFGSIQSMDSSMLVLPNEQRVDRAQSQSPQLFDLVYSLSFSDSLLGKMKRNQRCQAEIETIHNIQEPEEQRVAMASSRQFETYQTEELQTRREELQEESEKLQRRGLQNSEFAARDYVCSKI